MSPLIALSAIIIGETGIWLIRNTRHKPIGVLLLCLAIALILLLFIIGDMVK